MEHYDFFQLQNGVKGIHQAFTHSRVAHFGITIKAGSRDEKEQEQGLAHYIEHSIFKGTTKRKTFHILSRLDVVGGEINAYTTKEETCIYASFLDVYYERAIELIGDILFNSTFPEHEIEKEKDVIIDEINAYLDSPSEQIFDDFEELIYANHPIGRNILGTKMSVKKFQQQHILDFIKRNYRGADISFSSVGNITAKKLNRYIQKHLSFAFSNSNDLKRSPIHSYKPVFKIEEKKTYQAHCLMGVPTFDMYHKDKSGLVLLNNLLGGLGLNSRLNLNVREKYGLTYSIESNYSAYSDTGLFSIYFGSEKNAHERVITLIKKELTKLKNTPLGIKQLSQSKEQLKGHIALAQENKANLMLSLGKSILYHDSIDTNEEIFKKIDAITSNQLMNIANQVFDENNLSTLIYI